MDVVIVDSGLRFSLERVKGRHTNIDLNGTVLKQSFYSNTPLRVNVEVKSILASRQTWMSGEDGGIL